MLRHLSIGQVPFLYPFFEKEVTSMATRGRKPKPTAMKILEGNPGERPLNEREPIPPKGNIKCPS